MLSSTVTTATQFDTFPEPSVTVKVTLFAPRFVQSNAVCEATIVAIEQLSVEPPSISVSTIVTFPDASNWIVMS